VEQCVGMLTDVFHARFTLAYAHTPRRRPRFARSTARGERQARNARRRWPQAAGRQAVTSLNRRPRGRPVAVSGRSPGARTRLPAAGHIRLAAGHDLASSYDNSPPARGQGESAGGERYSLRLLRLRGS
jgi:hypothetical protein